MLSVSNPSRALLGAALVALYVTRPRPGPHSQMNPFCVVHITTGALSNTGWPVPQGKMSLSPPALLPEAIVCGEPCDNGRMLALPQSRGHQHGSVSSPAWSLVATLAIDIKMTAGQIRTTNSLMTLRGCMNHEPQLAIYAVHFPMSPKAENPLDIVEIAYVHKDVHKEATRMRPRAAA